MAKPSTSSGLKARRWLLAITVVVAAAAVAWAATNRWWPIQWPIKVAGRSESVHTSHDHGHGDAHHNHAGHSDATSIELSEQALKNIGYEAITVEIASFERTTTIPAIVAEQPGQTQVHITAPMTGIVAQIYVAHGQAIEPGTPMFDVRLTHEELVSTQRDYVQNAENLDVVNREIARLESLGEGVVARRLILEQQYEKQKLEAALRAAEQALVLHGLDEAQIEEILKTRKLLRSLTIRAPEHTHPGGAVPEDHPFHVQSLPVHRGQHVEAGQELAVLGDHHELFIEGMAFEDDAARLREAAREGWEITARLLTGGKETQEFRGLKLLYLADHIDPQSRAFRFYLRLPNEIVLDQQTPAGLRFIEWRFKPGQRMELRVPVEKWEGRIVLPVEAVIEEGPETYVYRQNGDAFERVPVHTEYRDRDSVVVANDGALFPGDVVAGQGAYQIHLALKNQTGGAIDPHAGHNH